MKSLTHLYYGDGKGKTTAAMGLAMRACGGGGHVIVAQFLKSQPTNELTMLDMMGIEMLRSLEHFPFTFQMDEEQFEACKKVQRGLFRAACYSMRELDLLVLDEVVDAVNAKMVTTDELIEAIHTKPDNCELVITGHEPAQEIIDACDYVTEMHKVKHPFDQGVQARRLIEF
jgi:cob(I)alamin adenosyltransferase